MKSIRALPRIHIDSIRHSRYLLPLQRVTRPPPGTTSMIDVIYILIVAAFLGGCVLYAIGCGRL